MKRIALFVILLGLGLSSTSQIISRREVREVKNSKLIVALTDDSQMNQALINAVDEFWSFCPVVGYMPLEEAKARAKAEPGIMYLRIGKASTTTSLRDYSTTAITPAISVYGRRKSVYLLTSLPALTSDYKLNEAYFAYALTSLQATCMAMEEQGLRHSLRVKSAYHKQSSGFEGKTLVVLRETTCAESSLQEIKDTYKGDIEFAYRQRFIEAILGKEPDKVYLMMVPVPVANGFSFFHSLVDAESLKVHTFILTDVECERIQDFADYYEAYLGEW